MRISDWSSDVCSSDLEDFQKILAAYRFDNEAVAIAMDHHAVTRKFEIGTDAQSLTLVVPEQFGFSWRDGTFFFPGHIDLLSISKTICIVLGKCKDSSPGLLLPYMTGHTHYAMSTGNYGHR